MSLNFNDRIRRAWESLMADRPTPVIQTQWGPVTEAARRQAALNCRDDGVVFSRVLAIITREVGGDVNKGIEEMKRRYPEAFDLQSPSSDSPRIV
jgi:hypothetical protein